MKVRSVCIVGLGYVGTPLAAKLATVGFRVLGLDRDARKVRAIQKGRSPIGGREPRLGDLVRRAVKSGRLTASRDPSVVGEADLVIICVATPFDAGRNKPDYRSLLAAVRAVGKNLRRGAVVAIESTLAPGTTKRVVRPALERATGGKTGTAFHLAHCPERVTPGRLLANLETLNRVIGAEDRTAADACRQVYRRVTRGRIDITDPTTAEVVKTTENAYRDVQIAFANEVALASETLGVDVYRVRDLVNKVPFRQMHLPGAGVGGHCLPKDGLLLGFGAGSGKATRLIRLAREVNDAMPAHMARLTRRALSGAIKRKRPRVLVLGYAFLGDSDDTRNTPASPLIAALRRRGMQVRVHDPFAQIPKSVRRQRALIKGCRWADAVVLVTDHTAYQKRARAIVRAMRPGAAIVDGRHALPGAYAESRGIAYFGVGMPRNASRK